ncbi:hypothetical protein X802_02835 [Thermococcus guaymasensis DSM 11113]|uniref:DUF5591 domain-containing protein n=1 Tax=Thermococcus guaymasensis DSM 11113 TaxID=1432656 RepID=A0A0X1KN36_9EURY|nr:DUF5591 domain-containing protein [Thermococcus guaymasensis]AJC72673.1 hypothetical protein X802_02835 [Thermococcus guaymasensis DSM 11113]
MNRNELYVESSKHGKGVKILPELCAYTPREVYELLERNERIHSWFSIIENQYIPPNSKKILLLYPCSTVKPFWESRAYKALFNTLSKLSHRDLIHLVTVSEPFGVIPEEFYGMKGDGYNWKDEWYDVPGLFEWWVRKHKLPYEEEFLEQSINILAKNVAKYLEKTKSHYKAKIAFVRTYSSSLKLKKDHTHRRIIEKASALSGVKVKLLPPKRLIARIVKKHGRFAWDMYGIAHPEAQEYLRYYLKKTIEQVINHE